MSKNNDNLDELKATNYEIFIWVLTVLALLNVVIVFFSDDVPVKTVAIRFNFILCLIFFLDFLHRLRTAHSRQHYFVKQYGWLDLLSSVPITGTSLARLFRLVHTSRSFRRMGQHRLVLELATHRADTVLLTVFLSVLLLMELGSVAVLKAEAGAPNANILTANDAFWWVIVTIATVGYGDEYPVTEAGRFVGVIVIVSGVALFSTLSGYLAHSFLGGNVAVNVPAATTAAIDTPSLTANDEILAELKQLREDNAALRQMQEQTNIVVNELKTITLDNGQQSE